VRTPTLLAALFVSACATPPGAESASAAGEPVAMRLELAAPERGIQLSTRGVVIEPGEDIRWCEVLQLPGSPEQEYRVGRVETAMTDHGRDLIVSAADPSSETAEIMDVGARVPCTRAGDTFGEALQEVTSAQQPYLDQRFPEGVGKSFRGGQKIAVDYHYVNDTSEPVVAGARINLHFTAGVERLARTASFSNFTIYTPPGGWSSHLGECTVQRDLTIAELVRRTERHGTSFRVWRMGGEHDGELLWSSLEWQDNRFEPAEPLELGAGEGFRFQCDYVNAGATALRYGVTAQDETCSLNAVYWTDDPNDAPSEGCMLFAVDQDGIAR
jgi:hypothetical protein